MNTLVTRALGWLISPLFKLLEKLDEAQDGLFDDHEEEIEPAPFCPNCGSRHTGALSERTAKVVCIGSARRRRLNAAVR